MGRDESTGSRVRRSLRILIEGRVQGVGFRSYVELQARGLGLDGWVRNRRDGSVEALIDGPPDAVRQLIDWAWQGPRSARVAGVKSVGVQDVESCHEFEIRPTE